jgi:hypothetical protein
MTPDRWNRIEKIYHSARELASADLVAYLAKACGDDETLRLEVESLLANGAILSKLESKVTSTSAATALTTSAMVGPYRIEA